MTDSARGRVAILYPGDRATRLDPRPEASRFGAVFRALVDQGLRPEPAVYRDEFRDEVRRQLLEVRAVLVWRNPIQDGVDRTHLDALLREVAAQGVLVSAHPDVIAKIGTKEVLHRTRDFGWGCDTRLVRSPRQLREELPARLAAGSPRVLKQVRGNGGEGTWKVELAGGTDAPDGDPWVRVRHAKRGHVEETLRLSEFFERCAAYFEGEGRMVDQAWQPRLPEGMVRGYLVHDEVVGFGLQAINALCPAPPGEPPRNAPQPGPRLYHPPALPEYQGLRRRLEREWVPALQERFGIAREALPVLWDCDFLFGPQLPSGEDSFVLCEINASSVAPFPDSALLPLARATRALVAGMPGC